MLGLEACFYCLLTMTLSGGNCQRENFEKTVSTRSDRGSPRETLRILPSSLSPVLTIAWNASGHATNLSGFFPYMVDLIAQRGGLDYTWVPLGREVPFDDRPPNEPKGLISLMLDGKGDIIVGTVVRTVDRYRIIDYTFPTIDGPFGIMIPLPERKVNKNALTNPFQLNVWLFLLVSMIVVIVVWYVMTKCLSKATSRFGRKVKAGEDSRTDVFVPISYAITVLLSQGNQCLTRYHSIRLVGAVWCLAAFVLVPAYSGNLLSYIILPTTKPLVNSIYDIVNVMGLKVAMDNGRAADQRLLAASQTKSSYGHVALSMQKTLFRCNKSSDCIDKVLDGGYVYIHGDIVLDELMLEDFTKTGKCRFSKAKETFGSGFLTWGLPKKSRFKEIVNKGLLELEAFGLSNYWKSRFSKAPAQCKATKTGGRKASSSHTRRITLPEMSSTFVLCGIGCLLACVAFAAEVLAHHCSARMRLKRRPLVRSN